MSFSLAARKLLISSSILGAGLVAFGCAAPTEEDLGSSTSALDDDDADHDDADFVATASINGWSITSSISAAENGNLIASATLAGDAVSGRSAASCLAVDLRLGRCESIADCDVAAEAAGLPKSQGAAGWQHYCQPAGDDWRGGRKRCWTRPGPAFTVAAGKVTYEYCRTQQNTASNGSTLSIEHAPVAGLKLDPAGPITIGLNKYSTVDLDLTARKHNWTAFGCLASGGANDYTLPIGHPNRLILPSLAAANACSTQDQVLAAYVLDQPIKVKKAKKQK